MTTDTDVRDPATSAADLAELRTSARGWHGVQLAVLGFIGLCGALQGGGGDDRPGWLQDLAAVLVLGALALACTATVLVASSAWPVYGAHRDHHSAADELRRTGHRLRGGIVLTFVAVACLATATSSAWWPTSAASGGAASALVEVSTRNGVACGTVRDGRPGVLVLDVHGQQLVLALGDVLSVRPVDSC